MLLNLINNDDVNISNNLLKSNWHHNTFTFLCSDKENKNSDLIVFEHLTYIYVHTHINK